MTTRSTFSKKGETTDVDISSTTIRHYESRDNSDVLRMFTQCHIDLIIPAFRRALKQPSNISLLLVCGTVAYVITQSVMAVMLVMAVLAFVIYYACKMVYIDFIELMLNTEMADIEEHFLRPPGSCFWVAEANGKVIATAGLKKTYEKPQTCKLTRVFVDPHYRRSGLGRKMMQEVLGFIEHNGYKTCVLDTTVLQVAAINLYKKMGFRACGQISFPGNTCVIFLSQVYLLKFERHF
ncbi:N-acetylaspartate synthetase-like [Protopterus annectens]|uniref:N-acetylaspartate synthetase-like n=1 Tax=Protopterus annectens TaxID=7888 RepID=UPI001CFC06E4|nr:N-acetylaspartate synthetase-like [Protopterus annectens]